MTRRIFTYVEEADDDANKDSALIQRWDQIVFSTNLSKAIRGLALGD